MYILFALENILRSNLMDHDAKRIPKPYALNANGRHYIDNAFVTAQTDEFVI